MVNWSKRSNWMRQKSYSHSMKTKPYGDFSWYFVSFLQEAWRQSDTFSVEDRSTIGSVVVMLREWLRKLTVIAMHSHTILILKTDICNAYMSIHPNRMTSSLFSNVWFIRYFYILQVIEFVTLSDLLQNQNPSTRSFKGLQEGFYFHYLELWNYMQFNMFAFILLYRLLNHSFTCCDLKYSWNTYQV